MRLHLHICVVQWIHISNPVGLFLSLSSLIYFVEALKSSCGHIWPVLPLSYEYMKEKKTEPLIELQEEYKSGRRSGGNAASLSDLCKG